MKSIPVKWLPTMPLSPPLPLFVSFDLKNVSIVVTQSAAGSISASSGSHFLLYIFLTTTATTWLLLFLLRLRHRTGTPLMHTATALSTAAYRDARGVVLNRFQ